MSDPEVVLEIVGKIIKWTYELASSDVLLSEQLDELEYNELKREIRDQYAERQIWPSEETENPDYL